MPDTGWWPSADRSISPSRSQKATCACGSSSRCRSWNTNTPLSSNASSTADARPSSLANRSGSTPLTSAPTEAVSLLMVSTLMVRPLSGCGFAGADHHRVGGVHGCGLVHDLDRHGDHHQGVDEMEQIDRILGQIVEGELVAVVDGLFQSREEGIVELLHGRHGARQPLLPALGFRFQTPGFGEGFQLFEWGR